MHSRARLSSFSLGAVVPLYAMLLVGCGGQRTSGMASAAPSPNAPSPSSPSSPSEAVDPVARFLELIAREPRHIGAHYMAARVASGRNEVSRSLEMLGRLAALDLGDQLEPADFVALHGNPEYAKLERRFTAAAPALGDAELWAETRCDSMLPEGTAWDAKRGELLLSSVRLRTVIAVTRDGRCREVVPRGDAGLLSVLGMTVDARRDLLWVAGAVGPTMIDLKPSEEGTSMLAQIDLARGKVVATYPLSGGGFLNDLTVAPSGDLYITESIHGRIFRLRPGATALEPVVAAGTFQGPNGIVALPGGELVVADFQSLWLLVPAPAVASTAATASAFAAPVRIVGPEQQYLGGFDGIALASVDSSPTGAVTLVGLQNLVGRGRLWRFTLDVAARRVSPTLLLRGHPDLLNPTTGALSTGRFLFVADPNLQLPPPGTALAPLPAGRTGHRVLSVSVDK